MANNIKKYYKDPNLVFNRGLGERCKYVVKRIELYKAGYDFDDDLEWNIKDAVVGEVDFSEEAMNLMLKHRSSIYPLKVRTQVFRVIYEEGCFKIIKDDGGLNCGGLSIYELCGKWNSKWKKWNEEHKNDNEKHVPLLRFEHVIPYKFYKEHLIKVYEAGGNTIDCGLFKDIMSKIHVCVVLEGESRELDRKFKSDMPKDWQWGDNPFARYDECDIKVWKGLGLQDIQ